MRRVDIFGRVANSSENPSTFNLNVAAFEGCVVLIPDSYSENAG
jgi:hypothetical protein